jgi:hypothetical protein
VSFDGEQAHRLRNHNHAKSTADRLRLASLQQLSAPSCAALDLNFRRARANCAGSRWCRCRTRKFVTGSVVCFLIGHYHFRQRAVRRKSSFYRAIYHSRAGPMPRSIPPDPKSRPGILRDAIFHRMSIDAFEAVIKVHLMGSFYVSHVRRQRL